LQLTKKGGRLTYSTCSFNPIENEAVVQAALMHFKGRVELVSVKALVSPHLKYRPGLTKWEVYHKKKSSHHPQAWYHNWAEVPEQRRDALQQSMFHEVYTD
jgi:16S rRNA C967 or C1407 C5-methylase (RsmB/RsmF family)